MNRNRKLNKEEAVTGRRDGLLKNMKKPTHGGKRKGSGRKQKEPTTVIRIPVALKPQVEKLIAKHNKKK